MLQIVPLEYDIACQRMQVIEDQLRQTPFLLGADFTAVDIVCGEVLVKASISRPCASAYFQSYHYFLMALVSGPKAVTRCWILPHSCLARHSLAAAFVWAAECHHLVHNIRYAFTSNFTNSEWNATQRIKCWSLRSTLQHSSSFQTSRPCLATRRPLCPLMITVFLILLCSFHCSPSSMYSSPVCYIVLAQSRRLV